MIAKRRGFIAAGLAGIAASILGGRTRSVSARQPAQGPVGTWIADPRVTSGPPQEGPPEVALLTFTGDGSLIQTNSNSRAGPGHGSWAWTGDGEVAYTFQRIAFDREGNFTGLFKVRARVKLNESQDEYTLRYQTEFFDLDRNLIFVRTGIGEGKRVRVEEPD